jgi:hypothetical protein
LTRPCGRSSASCFTVLAVYVPSLGCCDLRFSDFDRLHRVLLHDTQFIDVGLPPLPAKSWRRKFSNEFRKKRAGQLETFLKQLVKCERRTLPSCAPLSDTVRLSWLPSRRVAASCVLTPDPWCSVFGLPDVACGWQARCQRLRTQFSSAFWMCRTTLMATCLCRAVPMRGGPPPRQRQPDRAFAGHPEAHRAGPSIVRLVHRAHRAAPQS